MAYLVDQYGDKSKHDYLYPVEAQARAKVDTLLYWSLGMHEPGLKAVEIPFFDKSEPAQSDVDKFLGIMESMDKLYASRTSTQLNIADVLISMYSAI